MTMLYVFAVVGALCFVAERWRPARPQPVLRRGFFTDAVYVVVSILIRMLLTGSLAIYFTRLGAELLPDYTGLLSDQPLWVQAVAIIVVLDFFFYVMHRLKHRWTWWWRLHETHHSSVDLDWFSSVRFHPVEKILDRLIYLAPLTVLGVSDEALLILAAFDAGIASFSHANLNWRIGPLIYVFVGPELHRWHHTSDPARRECNYGNNISIFDWVFGTAYLSRENPTVFGVDDRGYPERGFLRQFVYAFRPLRPARDAVRPVVVETAGS